MNTGRKVEPETLTVGLGAGVSKRDGPVENVEAGGAVKRGRARGPAKELVPIGHYFPPLQVGHPVSIAPAVQTMQNDPRVEPVPSQSGVKVIPSEAIAIMDKPNRRTLKVNPIRAAPY